jgi:hypothetical protein
MTKRSRGPVRRSDFKLSHYLDQGVDEIVALDPADRTYALYALELSSRGEKTVMGSLPVHRSTLPLKSGTCCR